MPATIHNILFLGRTNYRNTNTRFGIKQADRMLHSYLVGASGSGKTTLLETMIMQDVAAGRGVVLLDPHGDLVARINKNIPHHRLHDVTFLDLTNPEQPYRYNPLKKVPYESRALVASSIIDVFKKLWSDSKGWGIKMEHILRSALLLALDQPESDLSDIGKLLQDKAFRRDAILNAVNVDVRAFWEDEFPKYLNSDILPVLNKFGAMLAYPAIRRVLVDNAEEISLRRIIDTQQILLVNLSKGIVGSEVSQIVGSLLLTSITSAAFSRASIPEDERVPCFVYLDEFQNFSTLSLIDMLSELRKYKIGMILAHQYMKQLNPQILDAVLGNVGTTISFRVDVHDATILAKKMYPVFEPIDFMNLPNYHIYLRLMIDGVPSKPFSAVTLNPSESL